METGVGMLLRNLLLTDGQSTVGWNELVEVVTDCMELLTGVKMVAAFDQIEYNSGQIIFFFLFLRFLMAFFLS